MVYYFDSSGIVKRYVIEAGTAWVQGVTDPARGNDILVVSITGAEVVSALVRKVPSLTPPHLALALASFKHDFQKMYFRLAVTDGLVDAAITLAERYRLRGYDAVQLAAAVDLSTMRAQMQLPPPVFVSADLRLLTAARAEGLSVEDPNTHP